MKPYGIFSDPHYHKWSAFSYELPSGVNSRLQASLDETRRCAMEVRKAGGNKLICGGDTFHIRGSVSPEVLNPVKDLYHELTEDGFEIVIISGNHDLESKESVRLSSAVTALEMRNCTVVNESKINRDYKILLISWMSSVADLKARIEGLATGNSEWDLIIHAPIDGVICGLPDHGLTADWLAKQGFKRVFAGHYHNHKDFGNGVYSIGSTSHLTWSDVGSKAGFLIVHEDRVERFASHAPEFIDLDEDMDPDDVPLIVQGNFVRAKVSTTKTQEINELRSWLMDDCGARGVVINSTKVATKARTGSVAHSVTAGASIEASIAEYIKGESFANADKVQIECQKILSEAEV